MAANIDQLVELGLKRRYLKAAERFWPGAVIAVIPTDNPRLNYLTQRSPDLAVRIPNDLLVSQVLSHTGPVNNIKRQK